MEKHAVSITQRQKLSRQTRNWGESRLAVEGQSPDRTPEHVLYTVRTCIIQLSCLGGLIK